MLIVVFHKTIAPKLFSPISHFHVVLIGTRQKQIRKWETNDMKPWDKFMMRKKKHFLNNAVHPVSYIS